MVPDFAFSAFNNNDLEMLRQINLFINKDINGDKGSLRDITRQITELINALEKPGKRFNMYTKKNMTDTLDQLEKDMTRLHILLGNLRTKLGGK